MKLVCGNTNGQIHVESIFHCVIFSATRDKHGGDTHLNSISVESLYHTDKSKDLNLYLKKYEYITCHKCT